MDSFFTAGLISPKPLAPPPAAVFLPIGHISRMAQPLSRHIRRISRFLPTAQQSVPDAAAVRRARFVSLASVFASFRLPFYSTSAVKPLCASLRDDCSPNRQHRTTTRRRRAPLTRKTRKKAPELDVQICIEESLPDDPELSRIAETMRMDVAEAVQVAFDRISHSQYETRENSVSASSKFDNVEISLLLCDDDFIRKLNKDWRDADYATDVLSMSQHIPELKLPILMLGDIVISVDTARRQAEERGHLLLDEIRILMVHGLLHLLGFDHEISDKAELEMEREEVYILENLGWKGKGLIKSSIDAAAAAPADDKNNATAEEANSGSVKV